MREDVFTGDDGEGEEHNAGNDHFEGGKDVYVCDAPGVGYGCPLDEYDADAVDEGDEEEGEECEAKEVGGRYYIAEELE